MPGASPRFGTSEGNAESEAPGSRGLFRSYATRVVCLSLAVLARGRYRRCAPLPKPLRVRLGMPHQKEALPVGTRTAYEGFLVSRLRLAHPGVATVLWEHTTQSAWTNAANTGGRTDPTIRHYATSTTPAADSPSRRPDDVLIFGTDRECEIAPRAFSAVVDLLEHEDQWLGTVISPYSFSLGKIYAHLVKGGLGITVIPYKALVREPSPVRVLLSRFTVAQSYWLHGVGPEDPRILLFLRANDFPTFPDSTEVDRFRGLMEQTSMSSSIPDTLAFLIPSVPSLTVAPFLSRRLTAEEAARQLTSSTLYEEVVIQSGHMNTQPTPPLPLRLGHVALQLATGHLDGVVGQGEFRHVVKGRVTRKAVTQEKEFEDGKVLVSRDALGAEVTTVDAHGRVHQYKSTPEEETA